MNQNYLSWIQDLKLRIKSAQLKASVSVNTEMIKLYWDIGKSIVEKQTTQAWGSKIVEQIAIDLKRELPDTNGFSRSNLFSMRKFYLFYKDTEAINTSSKEDTETSELVQQPAGLLNDESILCKIPWQHHISILSKCKTYNEAYFYLNQTIKNNWSRNVLEIQLNSDLIKRQGKTPNNFEQTLPKPQSDLAKEIFKDPYKFDFLTIESEIQELQLEKQLTDNITHFLLELGKGFAFVGRQYPLTIGNKERKIDLLFYHLKMHCYVVIDLKMGDFEPEFIGIMNYYLTAVDKQIKTDDDNPSIGIILCKSKEKIEVEYALQDINKPMGISEFLFNDLPLNIQNNLPTVEEIESQLNNF